MQPELGLSFIFISHDLGVIRYFCDRIAVMHRGEIVEIGTADTICARPQMPYTQRLLAAVPEHDLKIFFGGLLDTPALRARIPYLIRDLLQGRDGELNAVLARQTKAMAGLPR